MPKYKVWWIPQVPMKAFEVEVATPQEGQRLCRVLADYDKFQFDNHVKGDYSNVGGLQVWDEDDQDWIDWEDDEGEDIWGHVFGVDLPIPTAV